MVESSGESYSEKNTLSSPGSRLEGSFWCMRRSTPIAAINMMIGQASLDLMITTEAARAAYNMICSGQWVLVCHRTGQPNALCLRIRLLWTQQADSIGRIAKDLKTA